MDIEEFYDADERRRESEELELGNDWSDGAGRKFSLSYVVETGELYLMAAPEAEALEDPFGDIAVDQEPVEALTVEVIAVVPSTAVLHESLAGWQGEIERPGSLVWLRDKVVPFGAR